MRIYPGQPDTVTTRLPPGRAGNLIAWLASVNNVTELAVDGKTVDDPVAVTVLHAGVVVTETAP